MATIRRRLNNRNSRRVRGIPVQQVRRQQAQAVMPRPPAPKPTQVAAQPKQPTKIGMALRAAGLGIGSLLGAPGVGVSLGAGISRIFGQGDYVMNDTASKNIGGGVPAFSALSSGFRIQHREYLQDIQSSVGFNLTTFYLNPGLKKTFPWLSQVAQNFEEYKIHGMIVYLNSMSATAVSGTNTALGLWGVSTQYDPNDADFVSKQQAENYVGCQTAVPSSSIIHGIECKPGTNVLQKYFLRDETKVFDAEDSRKFYDMGKIQVFTQGSQAVSTIGEMWISYDIEFTKPKINNTSNNLGVDVYNSQGSIGNISMFTGCVKKAGSNLGTTVSTSNLTIPGSLPDGVYLIVLNYYGNASYITTGSPPAFTMSGSVTAYSGWGPASGSYSGTVCPNVSASGNNLSASYSFWVRKSGSADGVITSSNVTYLSAAKLDMAVLYCGASFIAALQGSQTKLQTDELAFLRKLLQDPKIRKMIASDPEEDVKSEKEEEIEETVRKESLTKPSYDQVD